MRLRSAFLASIVSLFAVGAFTQPMTIGNPWNGAASGWTDGGGTLIDLVHPAPADGVITHVGFAIRPGFGTCEPAATIKFFRETANGASLTLVEERTPIFHFGDYATVALSPPVKVRKGDLIGIHELTNCGNLISLSDTGAYLDYPDNITGTVDVDAVRMGDGSIVVWGTGSIGDRVVAILPVVGSAPGLMGSQWRTSVQLLNPYSTTTTGRMIFHRAQVRGSDEDSGMPYSLAPGETKTFDDIMFAMNETGVGSIDFVSSDGLAPIALTTIFNDAFGAGNFGMLDIAVNPEDHIQRSSGETGQGTRVLRYGDAGYLIGPESATDARFNMGVRTLDEGAVIEATLLTSSGTVLGSVTREYPPNFMEQMGVGTYFALPVIGGETVRVTVRTGCAIVFGSTVDNGTNDPSIHYVRAMIRVED